MLKYAVVCGAVSFLLVTAGANSNPPKKADGPKPVLVLRAHTKAATCVRFSPCGKRLATGGLDRRAALWDAATGKRLLAFKDHTEALFASLSFSPDGKRLAAWDRSPALNVWDAETGKRLLTLPAFPRPIFARVEFSPDGHHLASFSMGFRDGQGDPEVLVREARSGKRVAAVRDPDCLVCGLAYAPGGKRLATCGGGGSVAFVWELVTGAGVLTLGREADVRAVYGVAFSPDGRRLASACPNGMVRVWELASGATAWARREHRAVAVRVAFSPDGGLLASAGFDRWLQWQQAMRPETFCPEGEVILWSTDEGKRAAVLRFGKREAAFDLAWSPDGTRLATAHGDGTVKVWSVKDLLGR
jgi:WD40 repeat protein